MITMNERRKKFVGGVYDYVSALVDKAMKNNWKIVIWGFGYGGKFLRHLIQDIDGRVRISAIIDEKISCSFDSEPAIYRSSLLNYIDSSDYMILSSIRDMKQIEGILLGHGYQIGVNLFNVYADIGNSYTEFLHKRNKTVDFQGIAKADSEDLGLECNNYQPISSFSCVDKIFEEILALEDNISFFDFGCGKGAAIFLAYMAGIDVVGGVEISKSIYEQCVVNMRELGIECDLLNEDATKCNIDGYNCFFMYNPFSGSIFNKVIKNIQDSFSNNRRDIYLVYANPFMHQDVVKDGFFKLYKQIRTDLSDPLLNIYVIRGNMVGIEEMECKNRVLSMG